MNERPVLGIGKLTVSDRYWVISNVIRRRKVAEQFH